MLYSCNGKYIFVSKLIVFVALLNSAKIPKNLFLTNCEKKLGDTIL